MKPTSPPVAARFEVFGGGIELANGFQELNDPVEQRRRFVRELEQRLTLGQPAPPLDEAFLAALAELPACAGVASASIASWRSRRVRTNVAAAMSFAHGRKRAPDLRAASAYCLTREM